MQDAMALAESPRDVFVARGLNEVKILTNKSRGLSATAIASCMCSLRWSPLI